MELIIETAYKEIIELIDDIANSESEDAITALETIKLKVLLTLVKLKENRNLAERLTGVLMEEK